MTTDDNNRKTKVTDAELYEILSNVTHTLLDMDFVDDTITGDTEQEIEFMLKDGRVMRLKMTVHEIMEMMRFIYQHKELSTRIKLGPLGIANKELK